MWKPSSWRKHEGSSALVMGEYFGPPPLTLDGDKGNKFHGFSPRCWPSVRGNWSCEANPPPLHETGTGTGFAGASPLVSSQDVFEVVSSA